MILGRQLDRHSPRTVFFCVAVIQIVFFSVMPGLTDFPAFIVALGFMLSTLRLAAALTAIMLAFVLIRVGVNARNSLEVTEYEALRGELSIELNTLRQASTTKSEVLDALSTVDTSYIEGQRICTTIQDAANAINTRLQQVPPGAQLLPAVSVARRL